MRLIDADAMKRVYQEVLCSHVACIDCSFFMDDKYCRFETMLSEAPTVDAVPVVRCRDCKHYATADFDGNILCGCTLHSAMLDITADSVCSYGERKGLAD